MTYPVEADWQINTYRPDMAGVWLNCYPKIRRVVRR